MPASNIVSVNFVPTQVALSNGTLGAAAGRVVFTNSILPASVTSLFFKYTATATAGNRAPSVQVKDSSGNLLLFCAVTGSVVASAVASITAAPGMSEGSPNGVYMISLPAVTYVPPNGTITILDAANIDTGDSVTGQLLYMQG